ASGILRGPPLGGRRGGRAPAAAGLGLRAEPPGASGSAAARPGAARGLPRAFAAAVPGAAGAQPEPRRPLHALCLLRREHELLRRRTLPRRLDRPRELPAHAAAR